MNFFDVADVKSYLYEGLTVTDAKSVKLWEGVGYKLTEAQLTADQINQIFSGVEQAQTAAGGNRTMIGKGKDAATAVNKAWEDLKTKIQNSGPIQGFDQKVSDLLGKIGAGSADPQFNGQVSSWVQKYRDFAAKHPIAQGAIYATLIAIAGLSGAGVGGAATLGLLKMADKLLQGERFTSAAYSGAKTGGMAYAAGQIGQSPNAAPTTDNASGFELPDRYQAWAEKNFDPERFNYVPKGTGLYVYDKATGNLVQSLEGSRQLRNAGIYTGKQLLQSLQAVKGLNESVSLSPSLVHYIIKKTVAEQRLNEGIMDTIKGAAGKAASWAQTKGHNLTTKVTADKLQQAWKKAGSPMDSAQVAEILTGAGVSPDVVSSVYSSIGVPYSNQPAAATSAAPGYKSVSTGPVKFSGMAAPQAPAAPTPAQGRIHPQTGMINPMTMKPYQPGEMDDWSAFDDEPEQPATAEPSIDLLKKATASLQGGPALSAQELKQVNDYRVSQGANPIPAAKTHTGGRVKGAGLSQTPNAIRKRNARAAAKAAPTAAGANAFGQMATTLSGKNKSKSSTGGTIARTPTGLVHTAKAAPTAAPAPATAAAAPAATWKGRKPKVAPPPAAGAPTPAEREKLDRMIQQKLAGVTESLTWSKNFNPGMTLYRRMKKES